jgi:hypothetical protein
MSIKVSEFVKLVPQAVKPHLAPDLRQFKVALMPWLSQVYYDDKFIHYEIVKLPQRFGDSHIELGFHFESRDHSLNDRLLLGFDRHLFEIHDALGEQWYAEQWDRGWTKVYTVQRFEYMDNDFVEETAKQLASAITVMQPIYESILSPQSRKKTTVAKNGKRKV